MKHLSSQIPSFLFILICFFNTKAQNWQEVPYHTMDRPLMGRLKKMQIVQTNPADSNTLSIYAASDWSGLWKTTASEGQSIGDSWTNLTPGIAPGTVLPNLGITDFIVDETNTNYIYMATYWPTAIGKVFRSSTGGITWTEISPPGTTLNGINVNKLLISYKDPTKIFAGTDDGMYIINNARTTPGWTKMPAPMDHGYFNNIVYKPNPTDSSNTLYTSGDEIYRNENGTGWTHLSGEGSGLSYNELSTLRGYKIIQRRFFVDVSPIALYTLAIADNSPKGFFFQMIHPKILFRYNNNIWDYKGTLPEATNSPTDYGTSFMHIEIDPKDTNSNIVYAGGPQLHIFNDNYTEKKWRNNECYDASWPSCGPYKSHADMSCLLFNPYDTTRLYVAHDGGLSWLNLKSYKWQMGANKNLAIVQALGISCSREGTDKILVGTQDNGTLYYNARSTPSWTDIYRYGDGGSCLIYSDKIMFVTSNLSVYKTTNGGVNFSYFGISNTGRMKFDPTDDSVFYIGTNELNKISNASNKTIISNFASIVGKNKIIKDFAIAPSDSKYIYAIINHKLFKTTIGGGTSRDSWAEIKVDLPNLVTLSIDSRDADHIFLAYSTGGTIPSAVGARVIESMDGGNTWTDYSEGLPDAFPADMLSIKGRKCELYIATQLGIYYRNKSMKSWQPFMKGLPLATGAHLDVNYKEKKIIVGNTRGVWVSPLYSKPKHSSKRH